MFDTEDHPNAGPKTVSLGSPGHAVSPFRGPASGKLFRCKTLFFRGSGRNVWHWRLPQRRSKNGLLGLARPCCFPVSQPGFWEAFSVLSPGFAGCDAQTRPNATQGASRSQCEVQTEALSCKTLFFYRFWTQRLTLKITPTQVQKTISLGSPGHAVSLFRGPASGKLFRCKTLFFRGSGRNVWHWRSPQRRSKNGLLGLARPCCFPVSQPGFWEAFSVLSPGFAGCDAQTRPNATQGASRSQCEVQIEANARCKLKP